MAVILKIEHKDGQRTALWEVTESESSLLQIASLGKSEANTFLQITNPGRRMEWLAVRALLKEFYPSTFTIDYLENGKPLLVNHTDKISISHSGKMVGIAVHSKKNPGIDIEMIHPRIFKIAGKFLSEQEKAALGAEPSLEQLTLVWGGKEVMFKVYEHGGVSFRNDFLLKPFTLSSKGKLEGIIHKGNDTISIPMEYINLGDFVMVQTNYSN